MSKSIIGTVGVPASYGGFETLVENLLEENSDDFITVYCSSLHYEHKLSIYKNAKLVYVPLRANGVQSVFYDILSMMHAVLICRSENILVLGVSGAIAIPFLKFFSDANFVTNIDGLEWKRDKWGRLAKRFLKFSEKIAVNYSHAVVSDNAAIADYVEGEYGVKSKVIAYGGDHALSSELSYESGQYDLALCRIEPENNVELILKTFSQTGDQLKFIGNWQNSDFGKKMSDTYGAFDNIEIMPPIYDVVKLFKLREGCKRYIHGHSAGGTNPSLVEMMHFSKPVFAFDCSYNRATTENNAFYFSDEKQLKDLIGAEVSTETGTMMKEIANRRYTWDIVRQEYFGLFV